MDFVRGQGRFFRPAPSSLLPSFPSLLPSLILRLPPRADTTVVAARPRRPVCPSSPTTEPAAGSRSHARTLSGARVLFSRSRGGPYFTRQTRCFSQPPYRPKRGGGLYPVRGEAPPPPCQSPRRASPPPHPGAERRAAPAKKQTQKPPNPQRVCVCACARAAVARRSEGRLVSGPTRLRPPGARHVV